MSILAVNVAVPLPAVAGLLVGPGLAVHTLAKQVFARFSIKHDIKYDLALCTFSAAVSGAVAFALIESVAIVTAIAFATFSLLVAYEYLRLESQQPEPVNLQPLQQKIESLQQTIDKIKIPELTGQIGLEQAIARVKESLNHKGDSEALTRLEAKVEGVLTALGKREKPIVDPSIADKLEELSGKIDAIEIPQQLSDIVAQLDLVLGDLEGLKTASSKLEHVPTSIKENFEQAHKAAEQAQQAAEQARHASSGSAALETVKELKEALRRVEQNLAELKGSTLANAQANAQAMHLSALSRPAPMGPPSVYGDSSIYRWEQANRASSCAPPPHSVARSNSLQDLSGYSRSSSRSPTAFSEDMNSSRMSRVSGEDTSFDLDRTLTNSFQRSSTPEKAKPPQSSPVELRAGASASGGGDLKERILSLGRGALKKKDLGQHSLGEIFREVNKPQVTNSKKGFIPAPCHIGTRLSDTERGLAFAAAIVELIEEYPSAVNYPVWVAPEKLNYSTGVGGLGRALKNEQLPDRDKITWLMFAAMHGLNDLVSYLISKGADTGFKREERTFLHLATYAGAVSIIESHYKDPFGGGGVPLIFDAACAPTPQVLLHLVQGRRYSPDSLNTPQSLTATASVQFRQILRQGTKINALHLAILREDEKMLQALLHCKGLRGDTPADLGNFGRDGPTPLLLLFRWICEKKLGPEHIAVRAAERLVKQLVEGGNYNKLKLQRMKGRWLKPQERRAQPLEMNWTTLLHACPKESRTVIEAAVLAF